MLKGFVNSDLNARRWEDQRPKCSPCITLIQVIKIKIREQKDVKTVCCFKADGVPSLL